MGKIIQLITQYKNCFNKRNKNVWIFGAWNGEKFADNPKYLFLKALNDQNIDCYWITKNKNVYHYLKEKSYPVEMYNSEAGIRIQKIAGYAVYCLSVNDFNEKYIGGAVLINLWHGLPLKKIGYDDKITRNDSYARTLMRKILRWYPYKNTYIVSTSPTISKIYESAFKKKSHRIIEIGQPRNDMFFDDSYVDDFDFSEYTGSKLIVYMPTHRNEGKTPIDVESIIDLDKINKLCEKYNYFFVIKKHFYHKKEKLSLDGFSRIVDFTTTDVDAQELMKHADILITDYSSCYIDFLMLNRPIVFYNYDINDYLLNDREMYFPYDEVTPGHKITTREEFTSAMRELMSGEKDEYANVRSEIIKLFFGDRVHAIGEELIERIRGL